MITLIENSNQGRKGQLAEGFDADLVIWAPDETQLVRCACKCVQSIIIVNNFWQCKMVGLHLSNPQTPC